VVLDANKIRKGFVWSPRFSVFDSSVGLFNICNVIIIRRTSLR
jgi:hypothetical protein